MDAVAILRKVRIFANLNERQLARLARRAVRRQFPEGAEVIGRGETGVALYVVVSGHLTVSGRSEQTGEEHVLGELGPGEAFGEIALIDGGPRSADVRAAEPTECLMLSRWDFQAELERDPELASGLLPALCARIRQLQDRLLQHEPVSPED